MARHETKAQKDTIGRVMHEYKHGELKRGRGGSVKSRRQAVAIALREAGASNEQSPKENRQALRKTKAKEARGQTAQAETEGRGHKRRSGTKRRSSSSRGDRRSASSRRSTRSASKSQHGTRHKTKRASTRHSGPTKRSAKRSR